MEADRGAQAIPYWQRAGQRAVERSANVEAISHFTKGLELLQSLPVTPDRARQELALQLAVGTPLRMIKGYTALEVEHVYTRAYELSQQMGDNPQRFAALVSLWRFYLNQAKLQTARELAEQCFTFAQGVQDPGLLQEAHLLLGMTLFYQGEPLSAHVHLEQGMALYNVQQGRLRALRIGMDPGVSCLSLMAWTLWVLGYPDRALTKIHEALTLAQGASHAHSLGFALNYASTLHVWRREVQVAKERAEAVITLANAHGFIHALNAGMIKRGWALAKEGAVAEGLRQLQQGLAAERDTGTELALSHYLALLVEAYRQGGQDNAGLQALAEALMRLASTGECYFAAELHRLKGECLLLQTAKRCKESEVEECFSQALDIARRQQAKSLELRAAMSLSRLRQQQGSRAEAYHILAESYGWFTEGFETPDLQEAKALLEALQGPVTRPVI
jgi:predicted ATPase